MSRRVVITGMGGVTALGQDWLTVEKNYARVKMRCAIWRIMPFMRV